MANYPLPKFHFQVEWGGTKIGFTEVSGLDITNDIIEYRDGASPEYHKIKMPGQRKFSNIVMKRGIFKSDNEKSIFILIEFWPYPRVYVSRVGDDDGGDDYDGDNHKLQ